MSPSLGNNDAKDPKFCAEACFLDSVTASHCLAHLMGLTELDSAFPVNGFQSETLAQHPELERTDEPPRCSSRILTVPTCAPAAPESSAVFPEMMESVEMTRSWEIECMNVCKYTDDTRHLEIGLRSQLDYGALSQRETGHLSASRKTYFCLARGCSIFCELRMYMCVLACFVHCVNTCHTRTGQ